MRATWILLHIKGRDELKYFITGQVHTATRVSWGQIIRRGLYLQLSMLRYENLRAR